MIDISTDAYLARMAVVEAMAFVSCPSAIYRPRLFPDGDQWCALLGDDLASGVAGFGETPEKAMRAFDKAFGSVRTPAAMLAAKQEGTGA